ncbi:hypothetical protein AMECASPLE_020185 [Ameca splendens]|uniref:Uncharacterized protein n=1 Tax=Ameca splendens TaxID=208324 RepID=A0ABV0ZYV7_9TELE
MVAWHARLMTIKGKALEVDTLVDEHMAAQHKALTQPPVNTDSVPLPLRKVNSRTLVHACMSIHTIASSHIWRQNLHSPSLYGSLFFPPILSFSDEVLSPTAGSSCRVVSQREVGRQQEQSFRNTQLMTSHSEKQMNT